jgi:hypothetical protein
VAAANCGIQQLLPFASLLGSNNDMGYWGLWALLKIWLAMEMLFLFYAAWRHHSMSANLSKPPPYPLGRKRLFSRILNCMLVHKVDFKEFISGWFLGAPFEQIRHGNLEEFFAWAFFATSPDKINVQEELEVKGMISDMCGALHIDFPPGFTPGMFVCYKASNLISFCCRCAMHAAELG